MNLPSFRSWPRILLGLLCLQAVLLAAPATDPSGSWTVKVTGPGGHEVDSTLTLACANGTLTGTLDNRAGKVAIEHGTFANGQLSFSVTRKIRRRKLELHYTGTLNGDALAGTLQTKGRGGDPVSVPWTAVRAAGGSAGN